MTSDGEGITMHSTLIWRELRTFVRQGRIQFYDPTTRMGSEGQARRKFTYFANNKIKGPWFIRSEEYHQEVGIESGDKRFRAFKRFQKKPKLRIGKCTDDLAMHGRGYFTSLMLFQKP